MIVVKKVIASNSSETAEVIGFIIE